MSEPSDGASRERDKPWIFRTYAGHSAAHDSNALYRKNLAKGQTGLSVAFDLPTQTGYDSDHVLAKGEVGKVGVPISHLGDDPMFNRDSTKFNPVEILNLALNLPLFYEVKKAPTPTNDWTIGIGQNFF